MAAPFDRENLNEDVERMRSLWTNEMVCGRSWGSALGCGGRGSSSDDAQNSPEVLQYDDEMVSEMLDQIRNQVGNG